MASIRRTLSPYNDRFYQTGGNMFSSQSPSHKLMHNGKGQSPLSSFGVGVRRFIAGEKYSRKGGHYMWRRSSCRILLFFLLGFILGLAPFGEFKDFKRHDFSFEIKPPSINVQENLEDLALTRGLDNKKHDFSLEIKPPSINVQEKIEDLAFTRGLNNENVLVDKVELAVEKENTMLILKERFDFVPRKQLIVVTPTYNRALQAFYLNRLGQLLRLVPPPLLWIVVEMNAASTETAGILRDIGVMHRHLVCSKNLTNIKDRGVHQRNTALEHIENHKLNGIVYFADDDNMYSLELFESIREISRFGTWPVAMLAQSKNKAVLEGPVCNGSQVIGWHTNDKSKRLRRFHVDMSGFAFNSTILWDTKRWRRPTSDLIRQLDTVKEGFQETTFIEQIVEDESQMEATPLGCSNIMNWHLHLEANELAYPRGWRLQKNLDVILPIK